MQGKGEDVNEVVKMGKIWGGFGRGGGRLVVWERKNYTYVRSTLKCIAPPFISSFYMSIFFIYVCVRCLYYIPIDIGTFIFIPYLPGEYAYIIIVVCM